MHELAVCQALMEQVDHIAAGQRAQSVESIHLGIGPLSGVEPRLLEQAFSIARAGTIASQADLVIETIAVQVSCKQCGAQTTVMPSRLLCGTCGDWRTTLVSGDELTLQHIEITRSTAADRDAAARTASGPVN